MNRDFSLLDASLARVREGLRVLGEIARFIFLNGASFAAFKKMRHALIVIEQEFGTARLVGARLGSDPGKGETAPTEYFRQTLFDLIRANSNRAGESLRVLEEFSKLYAREQALVLEGLRYELYAHERALLLSTPHYWLELYAAEGFIYPLSDSPSDLIKYINGGARVVQLRDKTSPPADVFKKAEALCAFISRFNQTSAEKVLLIINDEVEVAARLPVAGIHLGQTDSSLAHARQRLGSNKIIGVSNNSLESVERSISAGADYVSIGPVFETPLKPGVPALGVEVAASAAALAQAAQVPLVAIGGINASNIHIPYQHGLANFAVIRAASEFFG